MPFLNKKQIKTLQAEESDKNRKHTDNVRPVSAYSVMQSPSSPIEDEIALTPFPDFANVHVDLRKTNEEKERLAESLATEKEIREQLEEKLNIANLELQLREREVITGNCLFKHLTKFLS